MKETSKRQRTINIDDIIIKLTQTNLDECSFILKEHQIQGLTTMARTIFYEQPMLLQLKTPIQICGDTHGQFKDLKTIFRLFGVPGQQNYLFLGDYVDRGKQSLQCICLLLAYKIKYPNNFFLLRGNHQSSELNKLYGFYDQCKRRTTIRSWKMISDCFNFLPLAAVVAERIFCVHGGLSPMIKQLSMINAIKRPLQPQGNRIMSDMLWADPKVDCEGWSDNNERGISYYYGKNAVDSFVNKNEFDLVCRSHQVVEQGYEFVFDRKLVTIFSAPNYCGQFTNLAAVLKINEDLLCRIEQFEGQPLEVRKRKRSLTPIRKLDKEVSIAVKQTVLQKGRKVTRVSKAHLTNYQFEGDESVQANFQSKQ